MELDYNTDDRTATLSMREYVAGYRDFDRVRGYCRDCDRYGKCWSCPPYDFDELELMCRFKKIKLTATIITPTGKTILDRYTAEKIIVQERLRLDKDLLEEEARRGGETGSARAFLAGACHICPKGQCTRITGKPCPNPGLVRPSLEAMGFDITRTTTGIFGIELSWGRNGKPPEYLTLVSGLAY